MFVCGPLQSFVVNVCTQFQTVLYQRDCNSDFALIGHDNWMFYTRKIQGTCAVTVVENSTFSKRDELFPATNH